MAHNLLAQNDLNIKEISLAVNYANLNHFAYLFKRHNGYSPSKIKANTAIYL